jgi:arylformamidase
VIDATSVERISAEWLIENIPKEADRIFLKTIPDHADRRAAITRPDPVGLDESAARVLASQNVSLVGIDGLSIAVVDRLMAVHVLLLEKSIVIVEHLDLNGVDPGSYEMMALPMSIAGAEAAPARVLIRPLP